MKIIGEFKEFISRGNVVDLAVGVIIGGAFGKIVTSMVNDLIMPPIGVLLKGVAFKDLFYALDGKGYLSLEAAKAEGAPVIAYGLFINTVIEFLIIAACVFLMVKGVNHLKRLQEKAAEKAVAAVEPAPSVTEVLLKEIRDLLRK